MPDAMDKPQLKEPSNPANPRSVPVPQTTLQCDICVKKDGWKGLLLQKCRKCGICVHEECYGVEDTAKKKDKNWVCLACRAIGTDIEGWTLEGRKRKVMTLTERPVECVLCSVTAGVHAMHPLYHYWGKTGRHVILPSSRTLPQRLAWVHTLCALSVCQYSKTRGAVYGCDENGDYEAEGSTAYFVMCGLNGYKKDEEEYMKGLKVHRELKCYVCGHQEKSAGRNLRVPLQCRAGDEDEFADFQKYHRDESCTQAMHVGCAMWGIDGISPREPRQVWFFPGSGDDGEILEDPVAEIFCECHAQQMGASMTGLKRSADNKAIGSTLLERTVCESEGLELPSHVNSMTAESLTKNPRMTRQKVSKVTKEAPKRRGSDSSKTTKPSEGSSSACTTSSSKGTQKRPALIAASITRQASDAGVTSKGTKPSDIAASSASGIQQTSEGSSAACATSSSKGTQKRPALVAASITRRASDAGVTSKGTKPSDIAASRARGIQQTPVPLVASVPRRASTTDATRTDDIADCSGGTAGTALPSTVPRKETLSPSTPEADLPTSRGTHSSKTTKPSKDSSAACASSRAKVTQKRPAPMTASIPRRASVTGTISKGTKPSDSAAFSARGKNRTPAPLAVSFPRRASATDATGTDHIADPSGGTAVAVLPSKIPRKVTSSPPSPIPKVPPLSAKQRANLVVTSHLRKTSAQDVLQTDEASMGHLSRLSQSRQVDQSVDSLGGDTFHVASAEDEPTIPQVATKPCTDLSSSFDGSKAAGRGEDSVPEDDRQQPPAKKNRSISEGKEDDANFPTKRKRRRCISEHKEDDINKAELDGCNYSQEDSVEDPPVDHDDGMWMDDDAYGLVKGEELNSVPPEGENPWAYLWEPGAPPFKMKLIECAERRNVEGLVKSLFRT